MDYMITMKLCTKEFMDWIEYIESLCSNPPDGVIKHNNLKYQVVQKHI
jgi:hypothetical protein